jgi:hypothetical protein
LAVEDSDFDRLAVQLERENAALEPPQRNRATDAQHTEEAEE